MSTEAALSGIWQQQGTEEWGARKEGCVVVVAAVGVRRGVSVRWCGMISRGQADRGCTGRGGFAGDMSWSRMSKAKNWGPGQGASSLYSFLLFASLVPTGTSFQPTSPSVASPLT